MKPIISSTSDTSLHGQTVLDPQPQSPTALNCLPTEYATPAGSSDPNFQIGTFPVQQGTSAQDVPLEVNSMNTPTMPDITPINPMEQNQPIQPTTGFNMPVSNLQNAPMQPVMTNTNTAPQMASMLNPVGTNPPGQNVQMTNP